MRIEAIKACFSRLLNNNFLKPTALRDRGFFGDYGRRGGRPLLFTGVGRYFFNGLRSDFPRIKPGGAALNAHGKNCTRSGKAAKSSALPDVILARDAVAQSRRFQIRQEALCVRIVSRGRFQVRGQLTPIGVESNHQSFAQIFGQHAR